MPHNENSKKYDLEERTAKFGENIIEYAKEGRIWWKEASELNLIFTTIIIKARQTEKVREINQ